MIGKVLHTSPERRLLSSYNIMIKNYEIKTFKKERYRLFIIYIYITFI